MADNMDSTESDRPVDTPRLTQANPAPRNQSDAHGNPGRYRGGRHNDPRRHAALDPQENVSKPKSTKATIQPPVSSTASVGPVCAESGSTEAAGDSAGEAETSVQGEAEPSKTMSGKGCAVRGTVDQLSMTTVIFPISDGVVVAVPKATLSTQLQESLKTGPLTTKLVLATKTSCTSGAIAPTTFVTSFVQGFPSSISLPAEFHDQVPASQVQQEGKGKDQYSLATGQVIVGVLVLVGFGKVIEHVVKKAWNALASQTIEEPAQAVDPIAEPRPLVQERPAGPTAGTIPEEQQQEYAAATQPDRASEECGGVNQNQLPDFAPSSNQMNGLDAYA